MDCYRAEKLVMRYFKGTIYYGLEYEIGRTTFSIYVDADYAGDTLDRKKTSGYILKLVNAACVWGYKNQSAVTLSTFEA